MKLINRQTGNNCYDLIKEYKGGVTARFYQTVAFFFDSNLKQPYNAEAEDRQIEDIVQEVERMYGLRWAPATAVSSKAERIELLKWNDEARISGN